MSSAEFKHNKDRSIYLMNIKKHLLRQNNICSLCSKEITNMKDASVDHKIPTSKGGSDHISNLQIVHVWCNKKKASN